MTKEICKATIPPPTSVDAVNNSVVDKVDSGCTPGWTKIGGSAVNISVLSRNMPYLTNKNDHIFKRNGGSWKRLSGRAKDIGVGPNGKAWVIGTNVEGGGFGIYRSNAAGNGWNKIPGSAVRIAVGPNGIAWVVNKNNHIFRYNGKGWNRMPGAAKDIGIGANGSVWVIGTNVEGGGFGIYRYNKKNKWDKISGSAVKIAVGPNGNPWVVNKNNHIFKYKGNGWKRMPGAAKDIGVGKDGSVWVIGTNVEGGGYGIYRFNC